MVKTKATKEETLAKFKAAREKKRTCLANLEKSMKEAYKKRTWILQPADCNRKRNRTQRVHQYHRNQQPVAIATGK